MLNRSDIIRIMSGLELDGSMYAIGFGAALVLHGVRRETRDIDISAKRGLILKLKSAGCGYTELPDGRGKIEIGSEIEMYETDALGPSVLIDSLPVLTLAEILKAKAAKGRDKDLRDIELIEKYISEHKNGEI